MPYQTFETADGTIALGVGNDGQWQRLCTTLGWIDLAEDARFRINPDRVRHRSALQMLLSERFRQKRSQEWVAALRPASVPISAVRTVPAVLADPQVLARDMIVTVDHPKIGELRLLGIPFKFSDTHASVRRHPPLLGEHGQEIRSEYGE